MHLYRTASRFILSSATLVRSVHSFSPLASSSPLSSTLLQSSQQHYLQKINSKISTNRKMTSLASTSVSISDAFDGGNGKLVKTEVIDGQLTVFVDIKKDPFTELEKMHHSQYFSFRSSIKGLPAPDNDDGNGTTLVKYVLANAGDASYPSAWDGSTTFYSTTPSEPSSWKRKLDTT